MGTFKIYTVGDVVVATNKGEEGQDKGQVCHICHSINDSVKSFNVKGHYSSPDSEEHEICLCNNCLIEHFFKCPICGKLCGKGFGAKLDTVMICQDCANELKRRYSREVYYCEYCREFHTKKLYGKNRVNETKWICDAGAMTCDKCSVCGMFMLDTSNSFRRGYTYRTSISGSKLCRACYKRDNKFLIKAYYDNPQMQFYYKDGEENKSIDYEGDDIYYGIELEVDSGGQKDDVSKESILSLNEEAYTKRDGSLLKGFEIITFPHTEEALYNMPWERTFDMLIKKGYVSHTSGTCGLHLHVNRRCFGETATEQRNSIVNLMMFFEKNRDDFIKLSRRESQHIKRWAKFYSVYPLDESEETLEFYRGIYSQYNLSRDHEKRYMAINLCKNDTIEFRLMRGTLKLETFLATLDVLITIAKNSTTTTGTDAKDWLRGIKPETKQYLKDNGIFTEQLEEDKCIVE